MIIILVLSTIISLFLIPAVVFRLCGENFDWAESFDLGLIIFSWLPSGGVAIILLWIFFPFLCHLPLEAAVPIHAIASSALGSFILAKT